MKKFLRILALCLIMAMILGSFAGCGLAVDLLELAFNNESKKIEELAGTWICVAQDEEEYAIGLLENIEMYEEEIALVDLSVLQDAKLVEFRSDKTYRFAYSVEETKACVYDFYVSAFADLYEGRGTLSAIYEMDFEAMNEQEFYQFYAELYGMADFKSLLTAITEDAYDYAALAEDFETGTYSIDGDDIMCTMDGDVKAEALGYEIEGNTLTLYFLDVTEVYTRVN